MRHQVGAPFRGVLAYDVHQPCLDALHEGARLLLLHPCDAQRLLRILMNALSGLTLKRCKWGKRVHSSVWGRGLGAVHVCPTSGVGEQAVKCDYPNVHTAAGPPRT